MGAITTSFRYWLHSAREQRWETFSGSVIDLVLERSPARGELRLAAAAEPTPSTTPA